jgi:hypothetical protein
MRTAVVVLLCMVASAWAGKKKASARVPSKAVPCIVTPKGILGLAPGMTLREALRRLPDCHFVRVTDGDGAELVAVRRGREELVVLHAEEQSDPQVPALRTPIDWDAPIEGLETFHESCRMENGLHPGSPLPEVEARWGKVTEIVQSDIESREYATFPRMPHGIVIRVDYCGLFEEGRTTDRYRAGGKIQAIGVFDSLFAP